MKRRGFFAAVAGGLAAMFVKPKAVELLEPPIYGSAIAASGKIDTDIAAILPCPEVTYYDGVSVAWAEFNQPSIGHALPAGSDTSFFRPLG